MQEALLSPNYSQFAPLWKIEHLRNFDASKVLV